MAKLALINRELKRKACAQKFAAKRAALKAVINDATRSMEELSLIHIYPHGGGEGRTGTGRAPVTPWGQLTKGYRTRNNKRTDNMIVSRRYRK